MSGHLFARRRVILADQLPHQAVAEIFKIVQPVAQIGIGGTQHARTGIGLHAFDGGFRSEAGGDRFVQLVRPAVVIGEHAIGFKHIAVLAAVGDVAAFQHAVEVRAQLGQRGVQPFDFLRQVFGDVIGDDDARLVQHYMSERDTIGKDGAGLVQGMPRERARRPAAPAPIARRRRSSRRAPSPLSAAPRLLPRHRVRLARFCTTSTPSVLPARRIGTPRNE